jgi:hypothetical protein
VQLLLFLYLLFVPSKTVTNDNTNWGMKKFLAILLFSIVVIPLVLYVWPGLFITEKWGGGGGDAVHYYYRYERLAAIPFTFLDQSIKSLNVQLSCKLSADGNDKFQCLKRRALESKDPETCFEFPKARDRRDCFFPLMKNAIECNLYLERLFREAGTKPPLETPTDGSWDYELETCIKGISSTQ